MKETKFFGITTVVVIIGFMFCACDNNTKDSNPCANGHAFSATPATCAQASIPGTCTRSGCNAVNPEAVVPALGHIVDLTGATAPACTATGSTGSGTCTRAGCGTVIQSTEISALGHDHTSSLICKREGCDHQYEIGDTGPAGGIIFHVSPAGFTVQGYTGAIGSFSEYTAYYFEAAAENEGSIIWGLSADNTLIPDLTTFLTTSDSKATMIGNGRKDTQIIANYFSAMDVTGRAAQVCANKSVTVGGTVFNDWFLPSLGELTVMFNAKGQPGIPTTGWFISSSQYSSGGSAWSQFFTLNGADYFPKTFNMDVRAVRAF